MLKECVGCKHCQAKWKPENVAGQPSVYLVFYCLKYNKNLGHMVKTSNRAEYLSCFEKRQEDSF